MGNPWDQLKPHLDYLDVGLAAFLGVVFSVLGLVSVLGGDALTQATLALLAVLAFSLLRDRVQRERLRKEIRTFNTEIGDVRREMVDGLRSVQDNVQALQTEFPYHTNFIEAIWEIVADDGSLAYMTRRRKIRFLQNNVASIPEFAAPSGTDEEYAAQGGPVGAPLHDLPFIERAFHDDRGRELTMISLQKLWKTGDVMELKTRRTLRNSFTENPERVRLAIVSPTDSAIMTVKWPGGHPPNSVSVDRTAGRPRTKDVPASDLTQDGGHVTYSEEIVDPQDGEDITLSWYW